VRSAPIRKACFGTRSDDQGDNALTPIWIIDTENTGVFHFSVLPKNSLDVVRCNLFPAGDNHIVVATVYVYGSGADVTDVIALYPAIDCDRTFDGQPLV